MKTDNKKDQKVWKHREGSENGKHYLFVQPVEDILLCDHLKPVALHLLAQVGVLTLLQLDERSHLSTEGLLGQTGQALAKLLQELLNLCLHKLRAVGRVTSESETQTEAKLLQIDSPELCGLRFHGDREPQHP